MQLSKIYNATPGAHSLLPVDSREILGITADSRQVRPGWLFVAERGVNSDGHTFIPNALAAGATAIVCETLPADPDPDTAWITVPDSAIALGHIASCWYGYPSHSLTLVGVTGTNGKTTIATLLYDMARMMGEKAGLLSTVVNRIDTETVEATHTTPDAITIQALMRRMVDSGCTFCAMEVSSHAAHQHRISGLEFNGAIFTNLTRDHLDYHKTVDNYIRAKKSFFDALDPKAFALVNSDDRNGAVMLQNCHARRFTYALHSHADFHARILEHHLGGMLISFDGTDVETQFTGDFNACNLLAVYATSLLAGWDRDEVLRALSRLHPVAGRCQTFQNAGVTAVVDYAHTPDALANILSALSQACTGAIITVTGAGGDRDKGKRPLMAAEAARYSRMVVLTSDNPRSEDPAEIAAEMHAGIPDSSSAQVVTILDRAQAIEHAIRSAAPGDVVLIAGKGHETYQIIGTEKRHFDDREAVREALSKL